jgi:cysteine desulfurase
VASLFSFVLAVKINWPLILHFALCILHFPRFGERGYEATNVPTYFLPRSGVLTLDHHEIYLDNHSSTRCAPEVVESMLPYFDVQYANPSSVANAVGRRAQNDVDHARQSIASMLGCESNEVVFTSGATESNNLALAGVLSRHKAGHVCLTTIEHSSVRGPAHEFARRGFQISEVPVDRFGRVSSEALAEVLRPDTVLVSIIAASNEIGTIQNFHRLLPIIRQTQSLLHVDATQAVGKIPFSLNELDIDLLSFSGHKLHGPKGIGGLIVRQKNRRVRLQPQVFGGGHERGLRSGTMNVPGIIGLERALRLSFEDIETVSTRVRVLRDDLWQRLQNGIPDLVLNGSPLGENDRLWNNLNCQFPGVEGQTLALTCEQVAMSSGSACNANQGEPSHVLKAIGLNPDQARSSLRFGLSRYTTTAEIETAASLIIAAYRKIIK